MNKPKNVKELCEFIWYLENRYRLLDFEIEGVKPWQAHRIEIYYDLARKIGVFSSSVHRGISLSQKLLYGTRMVKNAIFNNTFYDLKPTENLLFSHPRVRRIDGEYIDIYSHFLKRDWIDQNIPFLEFETPYLGRHYKRISKYDRYLDFVTLLSNIRKFFINVQLNKEQLDYIDDIETEIKNTLGVEYDLKRILISRTEKFLSLFTYYEKIFKKTKPKKVFVVVAYGRAEMIYAAKKAGVEVVELQHGTFSKYHLGYSYPDVFRLPEYMPDTFWVWNRFWEEMISSCNPGMKIEIYPFRFMEEEKKKYRRYMKKKDTLLVLSQSGHTEAIAKKIKENSAFFQKYKIYFKMHPSEYGRSNTYPTLQTLVDYGMVEIVEESDLYRLFAVSEYQAGVFSTALYEGVEFDCKTILFDLPGIEYMDLFIKKHDPIII